MKLLYYGNPSLRNKAEEISVVDDEVRSWADQMIEIMNEHKGIGLAGPQVGLMKRIFVSIVKKESEDGDNVEYGEPLVYINPKVTILTDTEVEMNEGCLSIPDIYAPVARPLKVEVQALDRDGNSFTKQCYGYFARHILHENDHLNGVLYVDRIRGKQRNRLELLLRRIKVRYSNR